MKKFLKAAAIASLAYALPTWGSKFEDIDADQQQKVRELYGAIVKKRGIYRKYNDTQLRPLIEKIDGIIGDLEKSDLKLHQILALDISFQVPSYEGTSIEYNNLIPKIGNPSSIDNGIRRFLFEKLLSIDNLQDIKDPQGNNLLMHIAEKSCRPSIFTFGDTFHYDDVAIEFIQSYCSRHKLNLSMQNDESRDVLGSAILTQNQKIIDFVIDKFPQGLSDFQRKAINTMMGEKFSFEALRELDEAKRKILFHIANIYQNEAVSSALYDNFFSKGHKEFIEKFKTRMPVYGPYWAMPIGMVRQEIVTLLKGLQTHMIPESAISRDERGNYFLKGEDTHRQLFLKDQSGNIGRIVGRNYLQTKLEENAMSQSYGTPMKYFTVPNDDINNLEVIIDLPGCGNNGYLRLGVADIQVRLKGAKVYAEYIMGTSLAGGRLAQISDQEKFFNSIGFLDFGGGSNLIRKSDDQKVYFIDTETDKNFPTNTRGLNRGLNLEKLAAAKNAFYPEGFTRITLQMTPADFAE